MKTYVFYDGKGFELKFAAESLSDAKSKLGFCCNYLRLPIKNNWKVRVIERV